jgi:hypothetical protein
VSQALQIKADVISKLFCSLAIRKRLFPFCTYNISSRLALVYYITAKPVGLNLSRIEAEHFIYRKLSSIIKFSAKQKENLIWSNTVQSSIGNFFVQPFSFFKRCDIRETNFEILLYKYKLMKS